MYLTYEEIKDKQTNLYKNKMEGTHQETGNVPINAYASDFGMIDFMDEANLDQFIDLIRGENAECVPTVNFGPQAYYNFDPHSNDIIGGGCLADGGLFSPAPPVDLFNFNSATNHDANANMTFGMPDEFFNEAKDREQVEETMDEEESSATTTTTTDMPTKKKNNKVDRSKTLTSERKRRGRMKEKLYALRSLVPNITKVCYTLIFSLRKLLL